MNGQFVYMKQSLSPVLFQQEALGADTRLELEAAVAVFQANHVGEVLSISFSNPSPTAHGHTIPGQFPARRAWIVYRPRYRRLPAKVAPEDS